MLLTVGEIIKDNSNWMYNLFWIINYKGTLAFFHYYNNKKRWKAKIYGMNSMIVQSNLKIKVLSLFYESIYSILL